MRNRNSSKNMKKNISITRREKRKNKRAVLEFLREEHERQNDLSTRYGDQILFPNKTEEGCTENE